MPRVVLRTFFICGSGGLRERQGWDDGLGVAIYNLLIEALKLYIRSGYVPVRGAREVCEVCLCAW